MGVTDIGLAFRNGLIRLFDYLPQLIGAIVILIIGYIVAKIIQAAVYRILRGMRFDRAMHASPAGRYVTRIVESPTRLSARIAYWVVFLIFVSFAVAALNLQVLNYIVDGVYAYLPRIIYAVVIFLVASAISAGADSFILRIMSRSPPSRIITAIVPAVTLSIAAFMILDELQIAQNIVLITYAAIMGSLALGLALAFGLGGRDLARTVLEQAYDAGRRNAGALQREATQARNNARRAADNE